MHISRPWRKHVQSFKKIGIKLYEELRSQDTHCLYTFIESEVRKWQSSQSGNTGQTLVKLMSHLKKNDKVNKVEKWQKQVAQRATIAHLSPMCRGQISFKKIQTHPSFNACSCYMKVSKGSNQKQQRKSGNTIFPIIRSIGVFLRRSRAANSVVGGPTWPKFELIHNIIHVLVTSKFEKDRININRDYVMTLIF